MTQADEPHLQPVAIASLRPTQMTVGYREVACKRLEWREIAGHDGPDFLGRHMVPVVIGWKKHAYLIDHHHLVRAVLEEGVAHVLTSVVADLSDLAKPEFWSVMDHYAGPIRSMPQASASRTPTCPNPWAGLPTIPSGHWPAHFAARVVMPRTIRRSARSCGLRNRIDLKKLHQDFKNAEITALKLAQTKSARHLPGWCGPSD